MDGPSIAHQHRHYHPSIAITLDLIVVTPVFADVWESRETIEFESQRMHVVSRDGLIKMKQIASRPQDLADIDALSRLLPPKS